MILAHVTDVGGGGSSGGGFKFLLVIAALGVLASAARLRAGQGEAGRGPSWLPWALAALGVGMAVASIAVPTTKRPQVYLTLLAPDPGATVAANTPVTFQVAVQGSKLARDAASKSGDHLHLYVDGDLRSMPYGTSLTAELSPGPHRVRIELVDPRHAPYKPPIAVSADVVAR